MKELSFKRCTFGCLLRHSLIKINFFDVLYGVKLNGCTRGITGFSETWLESHMDAFLRYSDSPCLPGLLFFYLIHSE